LALRQSLAAEEDPDPLESIDVPSRRLAENFDPDELLGITQACAAQVMVLDACVCVFMNTIVQHPRFREILTVVTSPRGFPLGEHRIVGDYDTALYGELLHIPCFLWRGDGQGALLRQHALTQSPDIAATLLDWFGVPSPSMSNLGRSLLPLTDGNQLCEQAMEPWPRDRVISVVGATGSTPQERAIRTPAWFLRQPQDDEVKRPGEETIELYRKPEDRWEVNELSRRCGHIVEQLTGVMDADEQALRNGQPVAAEPLAEELVEGID
jgi:arylsulfatase A-like enzyme